MNSIQLVNASIGTVSSREDGSVKLSVLTAELRPSESGLLMSYHGKAAHVTIEPHEGAPEMVKVQTERGQKSPSQRLHAVLFLLWKQEGGEGLFEHYYQRRMEETLSHWKGKLDS